MPNQYRGTLVFAGGLNGWTESYYLLGSDQTSAVANLVAIAEARINITHTFIALLSGSVSDVTIRGDSIAAITVQEAGTFADLSGFEDLDTALLIKWYAGGFSKNKTFLRGLPLGQFKNGQFTPTTPFIPLINAYQSAVQANALARQIKPVHSTPPVSADYTYVTITSATINTRIARRKSGRPIGLPRGRRLAG